MSRHWPLAKSLFESIAFFCLNQVARLGTFNYIVGSYSAFFSFTSCIMPLSSIFLNGFSWGCVWIFVLMLRIWLYGNAPFIILVHYVPGLCAAWYWRTHHWSVSVVLPLLCIVLFCIHPIGGNAALYSFYWLIPILGYFIAPPSLFLHCLSSTFIAHGVGSVIWLYGKPSMSVGSWIGLIPIVGIERLGIALGMMLVYCVITASISSSGIQTDKFPTHA